MKRVLIVVLLALAMTALAQASGIIVNGADVSEQMGYAYAPALDITVPPRIIVDGAGVLEVMGYAYAPALDITIPPRIVTELAGKNGAFTLVRPDVIDTMPDPRYRVYLPIIEG